MAPKPVAYGPGGDQDEQNSKKRKMKPIRACDVCRRKKIRCDGPQGTGNRCLNCCTFNTECTYGEVAKKRGPPKGYTQTLEARIVKLEDLLRKHCPALDLEKEVGPPLDKHSYRKGQANLVQSAANNSASTSTIPSPGELLETSRHSSGSPSVPTDVETSDDEYLQNSLAEDAQRLSINPSHNRYLGKASGVSLIEAVIQLKVENSGTDVATLTSEWGSHRRHQFWTIPSWEAPMYQDEHPDFVFPEPDLLYSLIDLFFRQLNSLSPLLHRPTFQANVDDKLHLRDHKFAAVLLCVCAIGSRFSDDPRVYAELDAPQSAGWKYYDQVHMIRRSLVAPPCIYDLQIYPLVTFFLLGSSAPHSVWGIIGIGLRIAQDVGANRRRFYGSQATVETELWKRAFWILVTAERGISAALGRPCTLQDEDIDVDWPAECDDEYWTNEDPFKVFKQPPGKPSYMIFYTYGLRLANIQASALRTIYSTGRRRAFFGQIGQDWEERTVAEMDSTLNRWFDDMPDHLRWMPTSNDPIFLRQSAQMHVAYYNNQILIHRTFISSSRKPTQLTMSCMAICTNAARSIVNIADVMCKRGHLIPGTIVSTFTSCVILLLHALGWKRAGISSDPARGMQDVHKGMDALKVYEERWPLAGAYWDLLWDLGRLADLPLPPPRVSSSLKRGRDSYLPVPNYTNDKSVPDNGLRFNPVSNPPLGRNFKSDFVLLNRDFKSGFVASVMQRPETTPNIKPTTTPSGTEATMAAAGPPVTSQEISTSQFTSGITSTGRPGRQMKGRIHEPSSSEPLSLSGQGPTGPLFQAFHFSSASDDGHSAQYHVSETEAIASFSDVIHSMSQHIPEAGLFAQHQQTYQTAPQTWSFDANVDQHSGQQQQQDLDDDVLAMWSNVPSAFIAATALAIGSVTVKIPCSMSALMYCGYHKAAGSVEVTIQLVLKHRIVMSAGRRNNPRSL
ncbi:hypothetical protein NEOLEDRAFT_1239181 [Neolentinus lepideus HHB14362 ss-1]|uniref:Zn(2)-C6 fungal-type domain-containing protein n=1 Tax=Neolentinus lepideus HHB14362 ss-1 TaxID=1314782 RepID=A0A165V5A9_9AGAM|nr:hypothetical protein NEOLEDRAFT_1239181 [Neolentinus lepideus HHB14362 ss-1]